MLKIKSIFNSRCSTCHLLSLRSQEHDCVGIETTNNQTIVEKIWQILDKYTYETCAGIAFWIFGKFRSKEFTKKIEIIIKKNPKLFACYYPKGKYYYCTIQTRSKIKTKFFE